MKSMFMHHTGLLRNVPKKVMREAINALPNERLSVEDLRQHTDMSFLIGTDETMLNQINMELNNG